MRKERLFTEWYEAKKERIDTCLLIYFGSLFLYTIFTHKIDFTEKDTGLLRGIIVAMLESVSLNHPWQTIAFLVGSAAFLIFTWFTYGALARMASSLGFTELAPTINLEVTGHGNIVTLPPGSDREAPLEKYDGTDILSPLQSARSRILDHIKKLRNN
jgi:hypothetical protein